MGIGLVPRSRPGRGDHQAGVGVDDDLQSDRRADAVIWLSQRVKGKYRLARVAVLLTAGGALLVAAALAALR
ncbi:hypothetical protein ACFXD5_23560 [Streptomyces sp. NPDC059385]|uniref:hypothetical protein n=1 Tax=Streptomyces sp. NPDC059385 TaxID=3346817 RepID=UPI003699EF0E